MGHTPRFDIFFESHFGIGVRWSDWPYGFSISIALPFFTITIGMGKDKQDLNNGG